MGTYRAVISTSADAVFRHEGEDDHSIEVHGGASGASGLGAYAAVPIWIQSQVKEGKRYSVSLSVTEIAEDVAAVVPSATEPGQVDQLAAEPASDPKVLAPGEEWDATAGATKEADKLGVEMADVQGTGSGGTVTKADVTAHDAASTPTDTPA